MLFFDYLSVYDQIVMLLAVNHNKVSKVLNFFFQKQHRNTILSILFILFISSA